MKAKMPQEIWVVDSDGSQYLMKGTHWVESDFGAITVMLKEDQVATFINPILIGFDDKITEREVAPGQTWTEVAEEMEGEE